MYFERQVSDFLSGLVNEDLWFPHLDLNIGSVAPIYCCSGNRCAVTSLRYTRAPFVHSPSKGQLALTKQLHCVTLFSSVEGCARTFRLCFAMTVFIFAVQL